MEDLLVTFATKAFEATHTDVLSTRTSEFFVETGSVARDPELMRIDNSSQERFASVD